MAYGMSSIFNGSIVNSVWWEGLERLLVFWLTGILPPLAAANSLEDFELDRRHSRFSPDSPLPTVAVSHCNPHRLQRDFLLYQKGFGPRNIRLSTSNGPLGNVAVIRRVPGNNQPVAGPCLIWRGSLTGAGNGTGGGYAQYCGKALHRLMYENTRGETLGPGSKVLHLCHRRACIQPSHLYVGDDADNAGDRARRFRKPYLPDIPAGDEPLNERLRVALFSDPARLQAEFERSGTELYRAQEAANYAITEIPSLEPPAPARFLVHECLPGPWAGSVHICRICNMTPGELAALPLLDNLLSWERAYPQRWWEYEESTKPLFARAWEQEGRG